MIDGFCIGSEKWPSIWIVRFMTFPGLVSFKYCYEKNGTLIFWIAMLPVLALGVYLVGLPL